MRIIGGRYKRAKLDFPKSRSVRPTMDRVKETLFNILGDSIEGKRVLCLFAGSGSLGLEALSRGACFVAFVDKQPHSIQIIQKNLTKLGVPASQYELIRQDALAAIENYHKKGDFFDFIFLDPPYYQGFIKKTLMKLGGFDILSRFSYLVFEHSKEEPVPESPFCRVVRTKKFGATLLTLCKKEMLTS